MECAKVGEYENRDGNVGEYEKDLAIRCLSAEVSKLSIENESLKKNREYFKEMNKSDIAEFKKLGEEIESLKSEILNYLSSVPEYWKESMKMQVEIENLKAEIETKNSQLSNYVMLVARDRDARRLLAKENEVLKAKIQWIKNDARLKELGR